MNVLSGRTLGSLHLVHWIVVGGSLLVTLVAWQFASNQVEQQARIRFDRQAEQLIGLVRERMVKYEEALWAGVALIKTNNDRISHPEWRIFTQSLQIQVRFPGINGLGVIYRLQPGEVDEHLLRERVYRPDYNIHPTHAGAEKWPITHIEPVDINRKAVGLDIAHERRRYEAARKAMDTGRTQITAPITLVQDARQTPGFLFYAPFYEGDEEADSVSERRERFIGMVYAPFIMDQLMKGTLAQQNRELLMRIHDGDSILFSEFDRTGMRDPRPMFSTTRTVEMYGRTWRFELEANTAFRIGSQSSQPQIILAGGILIDSMLLAIFILLTRSNRQLSDVAARVAHDLRETELRTKQIVDNIAEGVATIGGDGRIEDCNGAFGRIFGYAPHALEGQPFADLLSPSEARDVLLAGLGASDRAEHAQFGDITGIRNDGVLFPLEISITRTDRNGSVIDIVLARDISERQRAEAEARRLTERLMASNADLERFAYVASHDMQEPLRKIHTFGGMLREALAQGNEEDIRYSLDVITKSARRARSLVQDVLSYSTVQKQDLERQRVPVARIIEEKLAELTDEADDAEVRLEIEPVELIADPGQFSMLVTNLISNALKYRRGDTGHRVAVRGYHVGSGYEIAIEDNGIGFDQAMTDTILEPFKRLHGRETFPGTGIGLAICNTVCQRHGWQLKASSVVGEGSTFRVVVPATGVETLAPASARRSA